MVQAYVLIETEVGKAALVAEGCAEIPGVVSANDVTGPHDVILLAEARNVDELGKFVVAEIQAVDGITRTLICPLVHTATEPTTATAPTTAPLLRVFNPTSGDHFYTTSAAERDTAVANGYRSEGVACHVFSSQ